MLFLLLLEESFPCFGRGSLLQETVLYEPQLEFIPHAVVLHELLPHGSLFHGVPQEQAVLVWVPQGVTNPSSEPALVWALSFHGLQVPARGPFPTGFPQGHRIHPVSTSHPLPKACMQTQLQNSSPFHSH